MSTECHTGYDVLLFLFGSEKFCILLCNSTFYYALIYVIIQDWVTFGIFVFCFAFPYYGLFHLELSCEVVLCLRHTLHSTQWTRIRLPSRGMGIVLRHVAIFCHPLLKWLSCFSQKPSAQRIVQSFETFRVRKWWLGHPGSRAIRTRLSVWSYTQLFWCWNCWRKSIEKEYIVASILAWLQTLYFLFKVRRGHVIKKQKKQNKTKQNNLFSTVRLTQKFMCPCSPRLEKFASMPSSRFWQTYNLISTLWSRTSITNRAIIYALKSARRF